MFFSKSFSLILLAGDGSKGGLLNVEPGLIFWTFVTFITLLLVLKKIGWKPILAALDQRENFIKESLEKAEKAKTEAEKILEENKKNLDRAEEEAQKVRKQAMEDAEALMNKKIKESEDKALKKIQDAEAEISRKYNEAFENLKSHVAEIAVQAAEKILKENLDKEKGQRIVDKLIDEMPKN